MKSAIAILLGTLILAFRAIAGDATSDFADRFTRNPTIRVLPTNLKEGDQAILIIESFFDKPDGRPITLKPTAGNNAINADELFVRSSYEKDRNPENSDMRIYRVSLKQASYTFTTNDFDGLPENFKLPELLIYRE